MNPLNYLVTQSQRQEVARAASHPSRLMAHEHRLAQRSAHSPDVVSGARAVLPAVVAFAPLALMVGAAVATSDNRLAAWLSTWTIHGGAAQLVTLDAVSHQSSWIAAATAGLLIQARLSAYSTAMSADWRSAPLGLRVVAGLVLSDAPWALAQSRTTGRRGFYLGAGLTLFLAWPAMVTLGAGIGQVVAGIPAADLVPALVLGCTVVTQLRQRPMLVAASAAALSAVLTLATSPGVALVVAAVVGTAAAALLTDRPSVSECAEAVAS
ncbi:membrane hypothetical protein [metagenome]|uniref:AzlC family protein n=1 Tax=metagenome TaxID=256318 RepID=A0A2P2BZM2_9ZZZZ